MRSDLKKKIKSLFYKLSEDWYMYTHRLLHHVVGNDYNYATEEQSLVTEHLQE